MLQSCKAPNKALYRATSLDISSFTILPRNGAKRERRGTAQLQMSWVMSPREGLASAVCSFSFSSRCGPPSRTHEEKSFPDCQGNSQRVSAAASVLRTARPPAFCCFRKATEQQWPRLQLPAFSTCALGCRQGAQVGIQSNQKCGGRLTTYILTSEESPNAN